MIDADGQGAERPPLVVAAKGEIRTRQDRRKGRT